VSDIDTAVVDSLKVLDPERPIREANKGRFSAAMARAIITHFGLPERAYFGWLINGALPQALSKS